MHFAWFPETSGIIASTSLLIALCVILATYDDKAVFQWKGVTLNAVVSVISTASKASLLYSISQLISQWKWIIFTCRRRTLMDFERVDSASRGPMGSLELMWKCESIGWLRLGALIVLLSIATDPFTQQLIQYNQRVVYTQDMNTIVNRAGRFSKGSEIHSGLVDTTGKTNQTPVLVDADFSVQSSILYGLQKSIQDVVQQGTFNCPTGNCSWPTFESLAVCNRCTNLSSSLERMVTNGSQYVSLVDGSFAVGMELNGGTAFRLPNGLYLDNANTWKYGTLAPYPYSGAVMMSTFGTAKASETVSAKEIDTLVWSMSMIRAEPDSTNTSAAWPDLPLLAMECALFYCVNNYETVVSNGILRELSRQVADSTRDKTSRQLEAGYADTLNEPQLNSLAFYPGYSPVHHTDLVILSPETGCRFNISETAVNSISEYYQSTFTSKLDNSSSGIFNGFYVTTSGQIQYNPSVMQTLLRSEDLNATFTALAVSMSNAIRTGADEIFDGIPIGVIGSKGDIITFYHIVWPWISLHCFIVIVGVVFLVATIRENQRHGQAVPLWRSSGLAIASRGEAVTGILSGMQTLEEMWKKAKASRVTLFDKNDVASSSLEHLDFDPLEESESWEANTI